MSQPWIPESLFPQRFKVLNVPIAPNNLVNRDRMQMSLLAAFAVQLYSQERPQETMLFSQTWTIHPLTQCTYAKLQSWLTFLWSKMHCEILYLLSLCDSYARPSILCWVKSRDYPGIVRSQSNAEMDSVHYGLIISSPRIFHWCETRTALSPIPQPLSLSQECKWIHTHCIAILLQWLPESIYVLES